MVATLSDESVDGKFDFWNVDGLGNFISWDDLGLVECWLMIKD